MVDFKKAGMAALGVTGISYGLGYLYQKFFAGGIATIAFSAVDINVKQQIVSGINTSAAGKLLSYLQGVIPVGGALPAAFMLYIASFLVVVLGAYISEKVSFGKSEAGRFAFGMAAAAFLIGLVLGNYSVGLSSVGVGLALLIYFGIVSIVYMALRSVDGLRDLLPEP